MNVPDAEPWLSSADIGPGQRWLPELSRSLEGCKVGILCITGENVYAPWVLFEAGALAKTLDEACVIPLLLDVELRSLPAPLAQFQARKFEREALLDIALQINERSDVPRPKEIVEKLFAALWKSSLEDPIASIPANSAEVPTRSTEAVLEDVLGALRSLEMQLVQHGGDLKRISRSIRAPLDDELERVVFASIIEHDMFRDLAPFVADSALVARLVTDLQNEIIGSGILAYVRARARELLDVLTDLKGEKPSLPSIPLMLRELASDRPFPTLRLSGRKSTG